MQMPQTMHHASDSLHICWSHYPWKVEGSVAMSDRLRAGTQPGAATAAHCFPMFFKIAAANAPVPPDAQAAEHLVSELAWLPTRRELAWNIVDFVRCLNALASATKVLRWVVFMPWRDGTECLLLPLLVALFGCWKDNLLWRHDLSALWRSMRTVRCWSSQSWSTTRRLRQ